MSVRENRLLDPTLVQPAHYHAMLREHGRGWVAEIEGQTVGFAVADLSRANIWALFVDPAFERRGIGRGLHDVMLDWLFSSGAEQVWLGTDPGTRAEAVYCAAGWRYVAEQANGEARYEMSRAQWLARTSSCPSGAEPGAAGDPGPASLPVRKSGGNRHGTLYSPAPRA